MREVFDAQEIEYKRYNNKNNNNNTPIRMRCGRRHVYLKFRVQHACSSSIPCI